MYLKRIEIAGFKSFADRTVIDFEQGVTAVVGPNGSGKSNITEAIRWVLGEQSAKSLRGGKMPDIIFAGSQDRKPLNIAEVTVVLDNSDQFLPLDFAEISVTRRYNRNGDSHFFINKQACRLKDIQDLFMDSGLGKESFSIISQGKVEAIFNSKPEDRRGIFEEAAGVLKYKQRKKKAEQKLFETQDNLSRVEDIIHELEEQLAPLQKQRAVAQEFLALKESLTEIDVSLTVIEIQATKAAWEKQRDELLTVQSQLAELTSALETAEQQLLAQRQKRNQLDEQIEREQQQLLTITEALKQAEGQQAVLSERFKHTTQTVSDYEQSLVETQTKIATYREEKQALQLALQEKAEHAQLLNEQLQQAEQEVAKYNKSSKELLEELRSRYVEVMQEQANTTNELKHLERQYQQETAKNQQALARHDELKAQRQVAEKQQIALESQVAAAQQALNAQQQEYLIAQQALQAKQTDLARAQKQMYQMMNHVQQTQARQKSLQEIQENYAGFYQGVRSVLKNKARLSGIVGAVAELIDVPSEYTLAIETALGAAAQHVIVATEQDGRQGIQFLKQHHQGRATFLPLTTIKPRKLSAAAAQRAATVAGFVGIASELIEFPETIAPVIQNLLGVTVLADNLTHANQLAQALNYQYRVVSLEGDVMNPGGSMTGGANKRGQTGSLFTQGKELQQLTERLQSEQAQLLKAEKMVQHLTQAIQASSEQVEVLRQAGEAQRLQEQEQQNQLANVASDLERLLKEQRVFEFETRELQQFLDTYETEHQTLTSQQTQLQAEKAALDAEIEQINAEADQRETLKEQAIAKANDLKAQQAVATEQVSHRQQQVQAKQTQLDEELQKETALRQQIHQLTDHSSTHQVSEEALQEQIAQFQEKQAQLQASVQARRVTRQAAQQVIEELDEKVTEDHKAQQGLMQQQTQTEVQKNRAEMQLDTALNYLQEEYNLTFEAAAQSYELALPQEQARQEVKQLKHTIEQLGPVNLTAIEQYEQVNERHEFLVTQRDDLLSAKEQLFETMDEMDDEVRLRFGEVFEAIRAQFQVVFPNMFGGGKAELILTDPNDLLNTGIEIEAQPPGKKLQNLTLLSGGERALTAIALLFSIIRVRPVPFCVLDEVEAALDEANVARFGHYLSNFEKQTQFIVVTHRKGTMEAAHVLYGVTMQESGVSKIVSVRLEEVKEGGMIAKKAALEEQE